MARKKKAVVDVMKAIEPVKNEIGKSLMEEEISSETFEEFTDAEMVVPDTETFGPETEPELQDVNELILDEVISVKDLQSLGERLNASEKSEIPGTETVFVGKPEFVTPAETRKPGKCIVLCMCCNEELYLKEFADVMGTWGRLAADECPNVDVWGYTSSTTGRYTVDYDGHILHVPVMDSLNHSFEKTVAAIQMLDMIGIEYDWIVRTNCSTTVNVRMLNEMMETGWCEPDRIYVTDLFLNREKCVPREDSLTFMGNFVMFGRKYTRLLNSTGLGLLKDVVDNRVAERRYIHPHVYQYDDVTMAGIFNTFMELNGKAPGDVYRVLPSQYMEDIYNGFEPLGLYDVAIFNKDRKNVQKKLRNYFYDMQDRYLDFWGRYYGLMNGNLSEMEDKMEEIQMVEHILVDPDGNVRNGRFTLDGYGR